MLQTRASYLPSNDAEVFMRGLSSSLRLLLRYPRYTVLAVATLAAGTGVTVAMFGLLDALFFRPLPIAEEHRLVDIALESPSNRFGSLSYEEFRDIEQAPSFKDVIAIGQRGTTLNRNGEIDRLLIHYASPRYFPSLGIPMHLGRGFGAADESSSTPQVVINHDLWQERLGAPPDVIGRAIQLNNTMFTVIGVTAPGFISLRPPVRTDVWVLASQAPFVAAGLRQELTDRRQRWFKIIGRLADGADQRRARADLDVLLARWRASDPREYGDMRIAVRRRDEARAEAVRQGAILLGIVGLVLLIACANVANLTLARGESRQREMALRTALGASRARLLRDLVVESAVVSAAGAIAGLLLAAWLIRLFPALLPPGPSMIRIDIRFDGRLLAFTALLAVLTTCLIGLLPAIRSSRASLTGALKSKVATIGVGSRRLHLRDLLVVSEIALSGVVVIAAGLLLRGFLLSLDANPGFDMRRNVSTFYMVPGIKAYDTTGTYRFLESARSRVASLPGVTRVSYAIRLPAQGNEAGWSASFRIPGHEPPPGKDAFDIRYTMVGPGYFDVLGTRILQGRGITETDRAESPPVAIISESMAKRFWPGRNPIGAHVRMGRTRPVDRQIVGIAEDIRIGGLFEAPEPYVYVPYSQHAQSFGLLLVESRIQPAALIPAVRGEIARIDAGIPILEVSSFSDHTNLLLYEDRRNAWIGGGVALLALLLGIVGVYGVVSLVTARRAREIGIRAALGASRRQLLSLTLGRSVLLSLAGAAVGVAGGLAAGRLLQSRLHGLEPSDPATIAAGTLVVATAAIASSLLPAWRASGGDPAAALRQE